MHHCISPTRSEQLYFRSFLIVRLSAPTHPFFLLFLVHVIPTPLISLVLAFLHSPLPLPTTILILITIIILLLTIVTNGIVIKAVVAVSFQAPIFGFLLVEAFKLFQLGRPVLNAVLVLGNYLPITNNHIILVRELN